MCMGAVLAVLGLAVFGLENSPSLSMLSYMIQSKTFKNMLKHSLFLFQLNLLCYGVISELLSPCIFNMLLVTLSGSEDTQGCLWVSFQADPLGTAAPSTLGQ